MSLTEVYGPLIFVNAKGEIFLTCQSAGPDPEDYYDCKLTPGHSFDEVIRMMFRFQRDERESHRKDVFDLLAKWRRSLENIQKSLKSETRSDKAKP